MENTADSNVFGKVKEADQQPLNQEDGEGLAQPKGVRTRAAVAQHLAKKLKIDANADPAAVFAHYQKLTEQVKPDGSMWDQIIADER